MESKASAWKITGETAVLAVIGDPIRQARSPELVAAALRERGTDAVLVPMHVRASDLTEVFSTLNAIANFAGGFVTLPHKEAAFDLLRFRSPDAEQSGACNVFRRDARGGFGGTNLDGEGFVAAARAAGFDPSGRDVFIAGAGGVAAGIALALAYRGARTIRIYNRTRPRAEMLVRRVERFYPRFDVAVADSRTADADLVVNATSLGMIGTSENEVPCDLAPARKNAFAVDVVIRPEPTPFLSRASALGYRTLGGLPMLEAQVPLALDFIFEAS